MTPITLPATVGRDAWPVLSALRVGTSDTPAEFVVIVDCQQGTPTERYATLHIDVRPDTIKLRDGEYNLTWGQAQRSLAERTRLIPLRDSEVTVFAKEPHHKDIVEVFVHGQPIGPGTSTGVTVRTELFYLDPDDEDHHELRDGLRRAATMSPAAAGHATRLLHDFAHDNRIDAGDE